LERNTKQRQAILEVFKRESRPLSPTEILEVAQCTVPKLGIATVYRALKEFLEAEEITAIDLPGEGQRFEIKGKHHHHHFLCRECRKVFEVSGCPGSLGSFKLPEGFMVEMHEILFKGLCVHCS
jgi:Fur family ferric uptake transcriptional regulator